MDNAVNLNKIISTKLKEKHSVIGNNLTQLFEFALESGLQSSDFVSYNYKLTLVKKAENHSSPIEN